MIQLKNESNSWQVAVCKTLRPTQMDNHWWIASVVLTLLFPATDPRPLAEVAPTATTSAGFLACHLPLDPWNQDIVDSPPFNIETINLAPCSEVILSTVHAVFDNLSPDGAGANAKTDSLNLGKFTVLVMKFPKTKFTLSIRAGAGSSIDDLRTLLKNSDAVDRLITYLIGKYVTKFDIAWAIIERTANFSVVLKDLRTRLSMARIRLSTTISNEALTTTNETIHAIASQVDSVFVAPGLNPYYRVPSLKGLPEVGDRGPVFDSSELSTGTFISQYISSGLPKQKLIVGQALDSILWRTGDAMITDTSSISRQKAILELMAYKESCDLIRTGWRDLTSSRTPFSRPALAPCRTQWVYGVDPSTLAKKVSLLLLHGFSGLAIYDFHKDDHDGQCQDSLNKPFAISQKVRSILDNTETPVKFEQLSSFSSNSSDLCVPFLNLTSGCDGAFGFTRPATTMQSTTQVTTTSESTTTEFTITTYVVTTQPAIALNQTAEDSSTIQNLISTKSQLNETTVHLTNTNQPEMLAKSTDYMPAVISNLNGSVSVNSSEPGSSTSSLTRIQEILGTNESTRFMTPNVRTDHSVTEPAAPESKLEISDASATNTGISDQLIAAVTVSSTSMGAGNSTEVLAFTVGTTNRSATVNESDILTAKSGLLEKSVNNSATAIIELQRMSEINISPITTALIMNVSSTTERQDLVSSSTTFLPKSFDNNAATKPSYELSIRNSTSLNQTKDDSHLVFVTAVYDGGNFSASNLKMTDFDNYTNTLKPLVDEEFFQTIDRNPSERQTSATVTQLPNAQLHAEISTASAQSNGSYSSTTTSTHQQSPVVTTGQSMPVAKAETGTDVPTTRQKYPALTEVSPMWLQEIPQGGLALETAPGTTISREITTEAKSEPKVETEDLHSDNNGTTVLGVGGGSTVTADPPVLLQDKITTRTLDELQLVLLVNATTTSEELLPTPLTTVLEQITPRALSVEQPSTRLLALSTKNDTTTLVDVPTNVPSTSDNGNSDASGKALEYPLLVAKESNLESSTKAQVLFTELLKRTEQGSDSNFTLSTARPMTGESNTDHTEVSKTPWNELTTRSGNKLPSTISNVADKQQAVSVLVTEATSDNLSSKPTTITKTLSAEEARAANGTVIPVKPVEPASSNGSNERHTSPTIQTHSESTTSTRQLDLAEVIRTFNTSPSQPTQVAFNALPSFVSNIPALSNENSTDKRQPQEKQTSASVQLEDQNYVNVLGSQSELRQSKMEHPEQIDFAAALAASLSDDLRTTGSLAPLTLVLNEPRDSYAVVSTRASNASLVHASTTSPIATVDPSALTSNSSAKYEGYEGPIPPNNVQLPNSVTAKRTVYTTASTRTFLEVHRSVNILDENYYGTDGDQSQIGHPTTKSTTITKSLPAETVESDSYPEAPNIEFFPVDELPKQVNPLGLEVTQSLLPRLKEQIAVITKPPQVGNAIQQQRKTSQCSSCAEVLIVPVVSLHLPEESTEQTDSTIEASSIPSSPSLTTDSYFDEAMTIGTTKVCDWHTSEEESTEATLYSTCSSPQSTDLSSPVTDMSSSDPGHHCADTTQDAEGYSSTIAQTTEESTFVCNHQTTESFTDDHSQFSTEAGCGFSGDPSTPCSFTNPGTPGYETSDSVSTILGPNDPSCMQSVETNCQSSSEKTSSCQFSSAVTSDLEHVHTDTSATTEFSVDLSSPCPHTEVADIETSDYEVLASTDSTQINKEAHTADPACVKSSSLAGSTADGTSEVTNGPTCDTAQKNVYNVPFIQNTGNNNIIIQINVKSHANKFFDTAGSFWRKVLELVTRRGKSKSDKTVNELLDELLREMKAHINKFKHDSLQTSDCQTGLLHLLFSLPRSCLKKVKYQNHFLGNRVENILSVMLSKLTRAPITVDDLEDIKYFSMVLSQALNQVQGSRLHNVDVMDILLQTAHRYLDQAELRQFIIKALIEKFEASTEDFTTENTDSFDFSTASYRTSPFGNTASGPASASALTGCTTETSFTSSAAYIIDDKNTGYKTELPQLSSEYAESTESSHFIPSDFVNDASGLSSVSMLEPSCSYTGTWVTQCEEDLAATQTGPLTAASESDSQQTPQYLDGSTAKSYLFFSPVEDFTRTSAVANGNLASTLGFSPGQDDTWTTQASQDNDAYLSTATDALISLNRENPEETEAGVTKFTRDSSTLPTDVDIDVNESTIDVSAGSTVSPTGANLETTEASSTEIVMEISVYPLQHPSTTESTSETVPAEGAEEGKQDGWITLTGSSSTSLSDDISVVSTKDSYEPVSNTHGQQAYGFTDQVSKGYTADSGPWAGMSTPSPPEVSPTQQGDETVATPPAGLCKSVNKVTLFKWPKFTIRSEPVKRKTYPNFGTQFYTLPALPVIDIPQHSRLPVLPSCLRELQ